MKPKRHSIIGNIFLIIFICLNLVNINAGRFDGDPPPATEAVKETETQDENETSDETQPPVPVETEEPTLDEADTTEQPPTDEVVATEEPPTEEPIATEQPPTEEADTTEEPQTEEPIATEEPPTKDVDANGVVSPEEIAPEEESVAELLSEAPENTDIVVLDENGETVPLAAQEAADIIVEEDPMWCPAGVLPGGAGCTTNYSSIPALLNELTGSRRSNYEQDGIIYFTSGNTNGSFDLTRSNIGRTDFNALKGYDLTLQGGWNGANGGSATFTGMTNFGNNTLTIGESSSSRRWQGNIFLNNFTFNNVSSDNAITIYTTGGDISLDNISVNNQRGEEYTTYLDSNSGDITVENSNFDGNNSGDNESRGFHAETGSGEITISDTTFSDAHGCEPFWFFGCIDSWQDFDGATLDAPTVTLNDVISQNNDGNGIYIDSATTITLNNVSGLNNGDSGIYIDDSSSTIATVDGGSFYNNGRYGVEFGNRRGTLFVTSNPSCGGNRYYGFDGCYNIQPTIISQDPVLDLPGDITVEATGPAGAVVSFSVTATDAQDGPLTPTCSHSSGDTFPIATTTVSCSVTDSDGNTAEGSFTITVQDTTPPALNIPSFLNAEATSSSGAVVNYSASAVDIVDGTVPINCSPVSGSTFSMGWTEVNCSASDTRGNTASDNFYVRVRDTTPPVLNLPGNITAEATGPSGAVVTFSATATDLVDGSTPVTCFPDSGSRFPFGSTTVFCITRDSSFNFAFGSFTVTVQDTTPPTLNLPADITVEATSSAGATVSYSVSASDVVDGPRPVNCSPASGSTFSVGTTTVNCSSSDTRGNTASGSFNVNVVDTTAPTLTLPSDIITEATGPSGAVVTFSVTATDIVDPTPNISCAPASGSTFPLGTTSVNCSATDSAGNTASGSFNITVQDTTPPILSLPSDITAEATSSSGAIVSFSPTATDIVDVTVAVTCTPASGSTFPLGTTRVDCSATDNAGNTASGNFNVNVVDTTPPTLTLPNDITEEATGPSGAVVTFSTSATDIVDGSVAVSCTPASGSTFGLGTTTVNCSASDSRGNTANGSFNVNVVDTTPPTLNLSNITKEATGPSGAVVNFSVSADDLVSGSVAVTCSEVSGSTFPIGITTVDCSATDNAGNTANGSFTITVQDTTPPVIAPHGNIILGTWKTRLSPIPYTPPSTFDIVDGVGVATCTPAPGSLIGIGVTVVTCTATDSHGNVATPVTFTITIEQVGKPSKGVSSTIIPVTGGSLFDISCIDPAIHILKPPGARVTFINLCGYQAVLDEVLSSELPKRLPNGASFVNGVAVTVFQDGENINPLPVDASFTLGLPTPSDSDSEHAILYWDGSEWTELDTQKGDNGFAEVVSKQTGTFILVMK